MAYHAGKTATEPVKMARQAERIAIASARDERRLERDRTKLEKRKRSATEAAERQAADDAAAQAETR